MRLFYLHIIFICFPLLTWSQQTPFHTNYTTEDGLASNEVYWIYQSKDGLLWLGCDAGLVRYDGIEFKTYKNSAAKNQSINGITEDANGTLWCYNFASQIFYFKSDSLYLLETWERLPNSQKGQIQHFTPIDNNSRFFITGNIFKPLIYDIQKDSIFSSQSKSSTPVQLWLDDNRIICPPTASQMDKLYIFNKEPDTATSFILCPECPYYPPASNTTYSFIASPLGPILYTPEFNNFPTTPQTPFFFKIENDTMRPWRFPLTISQYHKDLSIAHIEFQGDSVVWMATSKGLFYWNHRNNDVQHYFAQYFVSDVHVDREHNIWISTLSNGLFLVPSFQVELLNLPTDYENIKVLTPDTSNHLLIAHNSNHITYLNHQKEIVYHKIFPLQRPIETICFDPTKQHFWINQKGGKTTIFSPTTQFDKDNTMLGSVKEIDFDDFGNMLVATGQGAFITKPENYKTHFPTFPSTWKLDTLVYKTSRQRLDLTMFHTITPKKDYITDLNQKKRCYSIAYQKQPYTIWLGASNGLRYIRNQTTDTILNENQEPIIANDILVINDSTLWVASTKRGLYKISHFKVVEHITTEQGLPSNTTYKLVLADSCLWIGTQKGLASFHLKSKQVKTWNKANGLPNFKIDQLAMLDHQLFFTEGKKLFMVNSNYKSPKPVPPLIRITDFKANNAILDIQKKHHLDASSNNIEISFQGISLKSQGDFVYQYRLLGAENEWITINSNNSTIRYPNLSHGDYTFEVKIIDALGIASEQTAQLSFFIPAPFYRTWWFNVLALIAAVLVIWLISRWQIRKLKAQNLEKLERSQLERDLRISQLTALKAQMNPHFVFNVLNSIQGLYISNNRKEANALISKFSKLVRLTLDLSEELEVPIEEEIKILQLYLNVEKMRVQGALDFKIDIHPHLHNYDIYIPSLLLQPYVENAIKHGLLHKENNREVSVGFQLNSSKNLLVITIDDNGIGREASAKINQNRPNHKSFATSANQKRLDLLNNDRSAMILLQIIDKKDDKGNALGTKVILKIPTNLA